MLSKLEMKSIYFEKTNYKRIGFSNKSNEFKNKVNCSVYKSNENDNEFKLTINLIGEQDSNFEVELVLTGIFIVEYSNEDERNILLNNAFSILFPYIRSQLTLLTSQPNMTPIVLPVVNIKKKEN